MKDPVVKGHPLHAILSDVGQEEQIKRVHAIVEQYKQEQTLIP